MTNAAVAEVAAAERTVVEGARTAILTPPSDFFGPDHPPDR